MSAPRDDPFAPPTVDPRPALPAASEVRDVRVFELGERGLAALRRRLRNSILLGGGFMLVAVTVLPELMGHGLSPLAAGIVVVMVGTVGILGYRMQLERFETYRIEIAGDRVTRRLRGFADATVGREELRSLVERRDGLLMRSTSGVLVFVRVELPGYAEIRAQLAEWTPVRARRSLWATMGAVAGALVLVMSVPVALQSNSKPLAAGAAALAVALNGYLMWDTARSKSMDVRAWYVLVPVMALGLLGVVTRVVILLLTPG
jgi:hypothetical protein